MLSHGFKTCNQGPFVRCFFIFIFIHLHLSFDSSRADGKPKQAVQGPLNPLPDVIDVVLSH